MHLTSLLRKCGFAAKKNASAGPTGQARLRRQFILEVLEDRTLPSTFTVLNLNDNCPGSLRTAVAASNATAGANTIDFAHRLHGTIGLSSGELLITNSVTINGPGALQLSVSGSNTSRVFEVAAGQQVAISGLTITHGKAPDEGGGILNDGSDLTLSADVLSQNVVFESTNNGARGGGLRSLAGTVTVTHCSITDNQAIGGTSAQGLALGGAINVLNGSTTINDSTISGNLARAGDNSSSGIANGGAIDSVTAPLTITDSRFIGNVAHAGSNSGFGVADGAAVNVGGTSIFTGCIFSGNSAVGGNGGTGAFVGEANGGALSVFGSVSISGSILTLNEANGGATGAGLGGGAFNDATSSLALTKTLVTLNQADGSPGIGGGVYTLGMFAYDAQTLIILNHASTGGDNIGP
jgi:hypothetical protein